MPSPARSRSESRRRCWSGYRTATPTPACGSCGRRSCPPRQSRPSCPSCGVPVCIGPERRGSKNNPAPAARQRLSRDTCSSCQQAGPGAERASRSRRDQPRENVAIDCRLRGRPCCSRSRGRRAGIQTPGRQQTQEQESGERVSHDFPPSGQDYHLDEGAEC